MMEKENTSTRPMTASKLPEQVTEWLKHAKVIETSVDRLQPDEKEAFDYIRNVFKLSAPDNEKLMVHQETLRELGNLSQDDFCKSVKMFARKVNLIIDNFEQFKNLVINGVPEKTKRQPLAIGADRRAPVVGATEQSQPAPKEKRERTVKFGDDVWSGMFYGDTPVDRGKITYANGVIYDGDWNEYGPHGFGTMTYDSMREIGQFRDGHCFGSGRIEFYDGSWYEGEWDDDGLNGQGEYRNGDYRERGMYSHGDNFGSGRIDYEDGSWYEGGWNNEGRHGRGIYYNAKTKIRFIGTFRDDEATDSGRIEYENGSWYEGGWNSNGKHGEGIEFNAPNKRKDKGTYKDDNRVGRGRMDWEDGSWYEGEWNNSGANGKGKLKDSEGTYEGTFKDHKTVGQGVITYPNGRVYKGDWSGYNPHGRGSLYDPETGLVFTTDFNEGNLSNVGVLTYSNGDVFEGTWFYEKDSLRPESMSGTYKNVNEGVSFSGEFRRGRVSFGKLDIKIDNGKDPVVIYNAEGLNGGRFQGERLEYGSTGVIVSREYGILEVSSLTKDGINFKGIDVETKKKLDIASWTLLVVSILGMWFFRTSAVVSVIMMGLLLIGGYLNSNRREERSNQFMLLGMLVYFISGILGIIQGTHYNYWIYVVALIVLWFGRGAYENIRLKNYFS